MNGLPGCPRGHYFPRIVIPADAPPRPLAAYATRRLAYNQAHSQSGWAAAQNHAADHAFSFGNVVETGAYRESARARAEGRADIAFIDAESRALIRDHDPFSNALQVIGDTVATPGEPVLTARGNDTGKHARAVAAAIGALSPDDRATLHLAGFAAPDEVPLDAYQAVPTPPAPDAPGSFPVASYGNLRPTLSGARGQCP